MSATDPARPAAIKSAFVWDQALASYRFSTEHPLNPRRLELAVSLIRAFGLLEGDDVLLVPPRRATDDELMSVHTREYIAAVRQAQPNLRYGLGTDDVPVVAGMHEAAALIAGGTLVAAELVMNGTVKRAFNISGGLHHAHRNQASGFCIYNDLALAIRWLQREHQARVMYIDYDAHHGDGVQWIFYSDPEVLTLSLHESGAFLFPGSGFIDEIGEADGYGYSVNVPLEPHTSDASLLRAFRDIVPDVAAAFKPDVIVLQNGCDAHALDPLTHLRCGTRVLEDCVRIVCDVADTYCDGRIVATGGGGYAIYDVVPRAWTLVWSALRGVEVPDAVPESWLRAAEREAGRSLPRALRDTGDDADPGDEVELDVNGKTVRAVRNHVLPLLTGWGMAF